MYRYTTSHVRVENTNKEIYLNLIAHLRYIDVLIFMVGTACHI